VQFPVKMAPIADKTAASGFPLASENPTGNVRLPGAKLTDRLRPWHTLEPERPAQEILPCRPDSPHAEVFMAAAVFRTKFTVPSLPAHHRPRPRLDGLWRRASGCRLVTVTAGAGWGKTEFLAARARGLGPRVLWYALDDLDRDPSVLAAHLAAACDLPSSAAPPLERLAAIVGRLERRSLLVLDDLHAIASAPAAQDFLARLLRYLPPGCALAVASREPVELAAARLEVRDEAVLLTEDDLAFDRAETTAVLASRLPGRAAGDLAPRIQELTEGWPTGVQICAQALASAPAAEHAAVLRRLAAGEDRWFENFVAEVLSELDPADGAFLLQTSVLAHLDPDLCDRLLRTRDSAERLSRLGGRGLFLSPLGDRAWRAHNLMRRSLRRRLERDLPAVQVRRLARRAADLLAAAGEPEAAAHDLIRAGDRSGASRLVARHAVTLAATRRPETLTLVLAGLPATDLRGDPALLLVRAGLAQLRGAWDAAEADLRRALRLRAPARIASALRARLVRLQVQRGEFARCLASGRRALARTPVPGPRDRGEILTCLGVAATGLGRLDQGEAYLSEALRLARRRGDRELEGRCLYLAAANTHWVRGDLDRALADATAARDLYRELGRRDLACHAEGVLGFVLASAGRLHEARESSLWALQRAEAIGYRQIAAYARVNLGLCDLLAGDAPGAMARLGEALAMARELGERVLETWANLELARAARHAGDLAEARRVAQRARDLATRQGDRFFRGRALAELGRLAEARRPGAGRADLAAAERIFRRIGAAGDLARLERWRAGPPASLGARSGAAVRRQLRASPAGAADGAGAAAEPGPLAPVHVRILGALEIDRADRPLLRGAWRSRRARRLFDLLILERSRSLPRDVLLEAMWPDADPGKTAGNLRQSVFQLRGLLEPPGAGAPRHVLVEGEAVRLDLGPGGTCDRDRFEALLAAARAAERSGDRAHELAHLQDAVALWRGPLLADTPYDPEVDEAGAAVRHRYLRACERLLELLAAQEQWDEVCAVAQRALAEDALHEPFAWHLIRGLVALGHLADARAAYQRFADRLARELDLLPSDALRALVARGVIAVA